MFKIRVRPIPKTTLERSALLCSEVRSDRWTDRHTGRVHLFKASPHVGTHT